MAYLAVIILKIQKNLATTPWIMNNQIIIHYWEKNCQSKAVLKTNLSNKKGRKYQIPVS